MDKEKKAEPVVDYGLCSGRGVRVEMCPEIFELRDKKARAIESEKCASCGLYAGGHPVSGRCQPLR